ncbi:MAG: hypothetical protein LBH73_03960 [Spirochaetaceae bacterium]|jgi:hypothetical protein|nr:hypothetical protein [Spirochaetaceae bacterium]
MCSKTLALWPLRGKRPVTFPSSDTVARHEAGIPPEKTENTAALPFSSSYQRANASERPARSFLF